MTIRRVLPVLLCCLTAFPALAAEDRIECDTSNGLMGAEARKVRIEAPRLQGSHLKSHCDQVIGDREAFAGIEVLGPDSAGLEALLAGEDGARAFLLAAAKGKAFFDGEEAPIQLLGVEQPLYRFHGEFFGVKNAEILAARVIVHGHSAVFVSAYPQSQAEKYRPQVRRIFEGARVYLEGVGELHATPGAEENAAPSKFVHCDTTNGVDGPAARQVLIFAPRIAGADVGPSCDQLVGGYKPFVAVSIKVFPKALDDLKDFVVPADGAERFILAASRGKAQHEAAERAKLLGTDTTLYRMRADLSENSRALTDAEVLIARVFKQDQVVFLWASYRRSDAEAQRAAMRRLLEQVRVQIEAR